ncbi:MAG: prephenate/arogenate dehydrogenase family protein [Pseudomonadota bacterium]
MVKFERLALVGLGLIGSSIALGARKEGLVGEIIGTARTEQTRSKALELGLVDRCVASAQDAVREADLVILCVPVGAIGAVGAEIGPHLKPGCILSDVGSVKGSVIKDLADHIPQGVHLVPGHPIAGTEDSGPESGFPELFHDRWQILTPPAGADPDAVRRMMEFWEKLGSDVAVMAADHHDQVLAITSHLPHLIAYTIVGTAVDLGDDIKAEVIQYSASGFRDFTRIAASDPVMWRDVFLKNKTAVLDILQRFTEDLTALQRAIRRGEGETLHQHFTDTRAIRRGVIDAGQEVPPVPPKADD